MDVFFIVLYFVSFSVVAFEKNESILIQTFHVQQPGKQKTFLFFLMLNNRPIVCLASSKVVSQLVEDIVNIPLILLPKLFKKDHLNHLTLVSDLLFVAISKFFYDPIFPSQWLDLNLKLP